MELDPVKVSFHQNLGRERVSQAEDLRQLQMHVKRAAEETQKPQQEEVDPSKAMESFKKMLEKLSRFFKTEAQFTIEREPNMIIVKIKDIETGEIVRQIPPEVAVRIAKNLQELIGILFDEKV